MAFQFAIRAQQNTQYSNFRWIHLQPNNGYKKSTRKRHTGGGTSSRVAKMTFRIRGVSFGGSHIWIPYNNLENTPILGVIMRGSPLWRGRWTQWTRVAWPNGKRACSGGQSESSLSELGLHRIGLGATGTTVKHMRGFGLASSITPPKPIRSRPDESPQMGPVRLNYL